MRRLLPLSAVLAALAALSACSGGGTASTIPGGASADNYPGVPAADAPPTPLQLTLGAFPATPHGRLAKGLCVAWSGLRTQYAANVYNDSPDQLNQWFSGPDWATARADAEQLGNDSAYTALEAAFGIATVGSTATIATAENLDKACAAG